MTERDEVSAIRGDSWLRRGLLAASAWVGVTVMIFLVAVRFGGTGWGADEALRALLAAGVLGAPASWLVLRRQAKLRAASAPAVPAAEEEAPERGYRGERLQKAAADEAMPKLRPSFLDYLKVYALIAVLSTGGVFLGSTGGHAPGVATALFAMLALPAVIVALGMFGGRGLRALRERQLRASQTRAIDKALQRVPVPEAPKEEAPRVRVETTAETEAPEEAPDPASERKRLRG